MPQSVQKQLLIGLTGTAAVATLGWTLFGGGGSKVQSSEPPATAPAAATAAADAADSPWLTDIQAVMFIARARHLDVLMEFTPNEDSAQTDAMEQTLNSPAFTARATEHFVLMRFESHSSVVQSERALATRDLWAERLNINTFPALVLLDNQGRAYAGSGLKALGGPELLAFLIDLQSHRIRRDEAFASAEKLEGEKRAAALDAGLHEIGAYARDGYIEVMEKIVAADPSNSAHLREKYAGPVAEVHIDRAMQQEVYPLIDQAKYRDALNRVIALTSEEKPPVAQMQLLLAFQGQLYHNLGEDTQAIARLGEAIALDPNSEQAAKVRAAREQITSAQKSPETRP